MLFLFSYVNLIQSFNFSDLPFSQMENEKVDWKRGKTLRLFILSIIFLSFSASSCFLPFAQQFSPLFSLITTGELSLWVKLCKSWVTCVPHKLLDFSWAFLADCSPIFLSSHQQDVPKVLFFSVSKAHYALKLNINFYHCHLEHTQLENLLLNLHRWKQLSFHFFTPWDFSYSRVVI